MAVEEHHSTVQDRSVHYYEDGIHHGRSILLLHGGIGDAQQNWLTLIPDLADEYHILAPDLPGFGGTAALPAGSKFSDMIAWLVDFLDLQGVEQVAVIGNSFGALIARLMAAQYPQVVASVVLVNGGFVPDVPAWAKLAMGLPLVGGMLSNMLARMATSADSLNDMIHHDEAITPELVANVQANASGFAALMQMTTRTLPTNDKPLVAILILWGAEDKSTSLAEGHKLKDVLTGADFVQIDDCGHLPHLEEPDIFEWQVKNFLTNQDPSKRAAIPGTD